MTSQEPFELIYALQVFNHLLAIDRKYHSTIRDAIKEQLSYEPEIETRNRKPLKRPSELGATWELRCGAKNQFRAFHRTDLETRQVYIQAIGVKVGSSLLINNEEFEL
jgi:hypothetical protein